LGRFLTVQGVFECCQSVPRNSRRSRWSRPPICLVLVIWAMLKRGSI
jgi:hypothetical protein